MKKITYLITIIILLGCQNDPKDIQIQLENENGYGNFTPGSAILFPVRDSINYDGVPTDLKEYVVRKFSIDKDQKLFTEYRKGAISKKDFLEIINNNKIDTTKLSQKTIDTDILMLVGTNKKGKRVIIIDSDNDKNFEKEKILEYVYPLSINEQDSIYPFLENITVEYNLLLDDKIVVERTIIQPSPYKGGLGISLSSTNPIENEYFLLVSIPQHKKGKATINNKEYTFEISNGFNTPIYNSKNASIFIYEESQNGFSEENGNMSYGVGDIFNADGKDYTIKKIAKLGNHLTLEYLKENDKPTGNIAGFYPPDFEAKMIDHSAFMLETYKGSYVLIDFWGTWCAPCIKAIPELKEVNNLLGQNKDFKLVSVAFDSDIEKVKSFTEKHEMNWEHIFVDSNEYNDNSIVAKFDITNFPSTILIDPTGKIVARNKTFEEIKKIVGEKNAL